MPKLRVLAIAFVAAYLISFVAIHVWVANAKLVEWYEIPCVGCSDATKFDLGIEHQYEVNLSKIDKRLVLQLNALDFKKRAGETFKKYAQGPILPGPGLPVVSGGGYTGPGDIYSGWTMWAGLRCYSAAYSGNAFDLVDTATGNTTGTRVQCSGGTLSALVSGSACTFVTGNSCSPVATTCAISCSVVTMYDQTGNSNCTATPCHLTQATNANRPIYLTSGCPSSLTSCAKFLVSTMELDSPTITLALPITFVATAIRTQNFTTQSGILDCHSGGAGEFFNASANSILAYAGNAITQADNDNIWYAMQFVAAASGASLNANGTQTTGGAQSQGCTTAIKMGRDGGGDAPNGYINEIGIAPISFTTQLTTLNTNMRAAYGGF